MTVRAIDATKARKGAVAGTAVGLTAVGIGFTDNELAGVDAVYITVETASLRYWVSGDTPTSSEGHLIADGGNFTVVGRENVLNLLMIRTGGTSADIQASVGKMK
jgi:hypothetical protein